MQTQTIHQPQPLPGLSRRQFLLLLVGAGVATVGGTALYTSAPWLDFDCATGVGRGGRGSLLAERR